MTDKNEFLGLPAEDSGLPYHVPVRREIELKPCPFCGSTQTETTRVYGDIYFGISCTECGILCLVGSASKEEAIQAWNRRVKE